MDKNKITHFYTHDHEQLDGYFQKFQELKRQNHSQAKEHFERFKSGLQRHIAWEEEILFPLFEEKTGMSDCGPTQVMRQEHRQIKQAMEALHKKVQNQDVESEPEEQLLWDVLKQHNMKEENILYPVIDQVSSDDERKDIFEKMNSTS